MLHVKPDDTPTVTAGTAPADGSAWGRLVGSLGVEEFANAWLGLQALALDGAVEGLLLCRRDDRAQMLPLAAWRSVGGSASNGAGLQEAAEAAAVQRSGVVRLPKADKHANGPVFIAYPVVADGVPRAVVAFALAQRGEAELRQAMRSLQWGAGWLRFRLNPDGASGTAAAAGSGHALLALDLFALTVEQRNFADACRALATELAVRLACERVAIAERHRDRCRLIAISHSADFDRRLSEMRSIEAAAEEAAEQQAVICCPDLAGGPVLVRRAHEELARVSGNAILTVPVVSGTEIVAVIVVEFAGPGLIEPAVVDLVDGLAAALAPALRHRREADRPILGRVGSAVAQGVRTVVGPRFLAAKLVVLLVVALLAATMLIYREYQVVADGRLEGETLRALTAPLDGYVVSQFHRAGQQVKAGDVLAGLDDRELQIELMRQEATRDQRQVELDKAVADGNRSQVNISGAQVREVDAQIALLQDKIKRAAIVAPFDGIVISGDLSQSVGAPVKRGDQLFQIAPLTGYRVVLHVPEDAIDDTRVGQRGRILLTSLPNQPFALTVTNVTPVTEPRDGRNTFSVEARLGRQDVHLRPGMEGTARLQVAPRSLLWLWSHGFLNWLRLKAWAWLP